ncbi:MAG: hypothetical protein V4590_00770 [Bacteroidota bacterium]
MKKVCSLFLLLTTLVFADVRAQDLDDGQIPFYAEPYYRYKPLKVNIGKYSDELRTTDTTALLALADSIRSHIDSVTIETLYILSVRLFDLGKKDESFYWFHTAKTRARIFSELLDPKWIGAMGSVAFERKQLFVSFNQIVGVYINGYGFNDVEKGASIMEKVKEEVKSIQPYKDVYNTMLFLPDSSIIPLKVKKEKELEDAVVYYRTHKEEIKKKRIEAGIQDKY